MTDRTHEAGRRFAAQYNTDGQREDQDATPELSALKRAISHAVNCESIDAQCNTADHVLADKLAPRVLAHLAGETGVQAYERMSPEQRALIGSGDGVVPPPTEVWTLAQSRPSPPGPDAGELRADVAAISEMVSLYGGNEEYDAWQRIRAALRTSEEGADRG